MKKNVCVLGACNYDLVGRCCTAYRPGDASQGILRLQSGGVGRNLAQGIYKAGHHVNFISVLGDDLFGRELEKELMSQGFSFYKIQREKSDLFLGLEEPNGELYGALADMRGIESLDFFEIPHRFFEEAHALVLDCCLSETFLRDLFSRYSHKKIFVDGVSVDRVKRILPFLDHIDLLKINISEAKALTGSMTKEKALEELFKRGLGAVLLSLGAQGVHYEDSHGCLQGRKEAKEVLSTLGAGDALFSAFIGSLLGDASVEEAMEKGLESALETIGHEGSWKG